MKPYAKNPREVSSPGNTPTTIRRKNRTIIMSLAFLSSAALAQSSSLSRRRGSFLFSRTSSATALFVSSARSFRGKTTTTRNLIGGGSVVVRTQQRQQQRNWNRRHLHRPIFSPAAVSAGGCYHDVCPLSMNAAAKTASSEYNDGGGGDDNDEEYNTSVEEGEGKRQCFQVTANFPPSGDQPEAIERLVKQLEEGDKFSVLRGITGTGKTLVMSHVIARCNKPTLVLCHNKTLAAQLARELRSFLRNNSVELFVSYYNHFVPESYSETTGKYVAKKSSINNEIDVLRHRATRALLTRRDVVVVASVSCIYGLGVPEEYLQASTSIEVDHHHGGVAVPEDENDPLRSFDDWNDLTGQLDSMLYEYNPDDEDFSRGQYQVRETQNNAEKTHTVTVTLWPPHEQFPMQIELQRRQQGAFSICAIREGNPQGFLSVSSSRIFPAKHHVTSEDRLQEACSAIEDELRHRYQELVDDKKLVEADRLQQRVLQDLMMLKETGWCSSGENYSRHFAGRRAGEPPATLLNYLKLLHRDDWMLMVDESHVTLPQLKAMYAGDQARKRSLIKHGYRLPSALDNRPLRDHEFWERINQAVFVSATPSKQELEWTERDPVDMIIRPTFVCDPEIDVRPVNNQLNDLLEEVRKCVSEKQRSLTVTLTKRDAEDLAHFLNENGVKSSYIHSDLTTHERSDALRALQSGEIDCLVGVNLLREGLDLPQVSLVAILGADCEGFLRSETALLQTVGRASRHIHGKAIFYADRITESMRNCIETTKSRREKQLEFNTRFGCDMRSAQGSSTMSIFDLLKDQIEAEQVVGFNDGSDDSGKRKIHLTPGSALLQDLSGSSIVLKPGPENMGVVTDHIPTSPGVYFWRDSLGKILYIGKAVNLRSRVKSYVPANARHSRRIEVMLEKAMSVDFVITPSERDALVLESNLIKHHQPPFNVLLKDDAHYPYICASIGDSFPRFSMVPHREAPSPSNQKYRYFGPYTSFGEINTILHGIEEKYDLRSQSFLARHGSVSKEEYNNSFNAALQEVFDNNKKDYDESTLKEMRSKYEEAGNLFDSKFNFCRDVVAFCPVHDSDAIVHVMQLRDGIIAGSFSYTCEIPFGLTDETDISAALQLVLERQHYPAGEEASCGKFSWFPNEVLVSHSLLQPENLQKVIREARKKVEDSNQKRVTRITTVASKGAKRKVDERALLFASQNAQQAAHERSVKNVDARAISEASRQLADLVSVANKPSRIECYDISHTQGSYPVGSRVVFIDGKPVPHLYRTFNIRSEGSTNDNYGRDDYASLAQVLERRFHRAWLNGVEGGLVNEDDPWALPDLVVVDGGPGQLSAAIKGMSRAHISPKTASLFFQADNFDTGKKAEVPICALAKNQEHVYVHGKSEPVNASSDSPAMLLLRSLRDESHRFALKNHRRRRSVHRQVMEYVTENTTMFELEQEEAA